MLDNAQFDLECQLANIIVHHPHLHRRKVHFRTDAGRVIMEGQVNSYFEKQLAQEALRAVQGIDSIDNLLEVCWAE